MTSNPVGDEAGEVSGCGVQVVARAGEDVRLLSWARKLEDLIAG